MHSGFYLTLANFVKAMHVEKGQSWCQIQKMSISLLATFLNLGDELFCLCYYMLLKKMDMTRFGQVEANASATYIAGSYRITCDIKSDATFETP